jgi:hypothetical protein
VSGAGNGLKPALLQVRKRLSAGLRRRLRPGAPEPGYVAMTPPAPAPDRAGICIVSVFKDEAPYFAEWITFHRMLGVRAFILYDNGSTDESRAVLAPFEAEGVVRVVDWRVFTDLERPQGLAHAHAVVNYGAAYRWMACIDVDEFLFPLAGDSLPATLGDYAHLPSLSLPWFNFGPDGHVEKPPGLVIENYRERAVYPFRSDQYSLVRHKTLVDPSRVSAAGTHLHAIDGGPPASFNERGERITRETARDFRLQCCERLRLNHYFTRSEAEMARKLAKGRVSRRGAVAMNALDNRLRQYRLATERDEAIQRFVPALKAALKADQP